MIQNTNCETITISTVGSLTASDEQLSEDAKQALDVARSAGSAQKIDVDDPVLDVPDAVNGWVARNDPTAHVGYGDSPFEALLDLVEKLSDDVESPEQGESSSSFSA